MTFRQAICLSRSSNRSDGVQAGEDLVTLHCFAWPRIAADDVQTGMLVLRHRERCPNGESCTGRLASCGHGHGEEAGGGREVGGGGGPASAHAAGADPSRFTPLPRLRGVGGVLQCRITLSSLGFVWILASAVRSDKCPRLAGSPRHRHRRPSASRVERVVRGTASSSLILMTAESRQCYNSRTPAHDRHVGALSIEP